MLNFDHLNHAVLQRVEECKQLDHLLFQEKVGQAEFGSRAVLTAEFNLADDSRRRIEDRLPVIDYKAFQPTEIKPLEELQKLSTRWG